MVLSFYLVFLVESQDSHQGAVLLLDEPGLSLHPLAQRDLSAFFEGLSETNQLIYTTHSPILVDADHLDRARKVFVTKDGTTKATPDLRGGDADPLQRGSNYAVHSALGISVAESLMIGCTPIVVEGASDQYYLSAIKTIFIAAGRSTPGRELVFAPAGGVKGVKALAAILGSKDSDLPGRLVDGDEAGEKFAKDLRSGLYAAMGDRVLEMNTFVDIARAEVEDLIPLDILAREVDREFQGSGGSVRGCRCRRPTGASAGRGLGVREWDSLGTWLGSRHARKVKTALISRGHSKLSDDTLKVWTDLFAALTRAS